MVNYIYMLMASLLLSCTIPNQETIRSHFINITLPKISDNASGQFKLISNDFLKYLPGEIEKSPNLYRMLTIETNMNLFQRYYVEIDYLTYSEFRGNTFEINNISDNYSIFSGQSIWSYAFNQLFFEYYEVNILSNRLKVRKLIPGFKILKNDKEIHIEIQMEKLKFDSIVFKYTLKNSTSGYKVSRLNGSEINLTEILKINNEDLENFEIVSIGFLK